ncbi:MAG: hypothetical protein DI598_15920 [Pseudopedobacter saltans]|uniref:DUF2971 domain-containing protein n=1 Tax=Pseudopedobacter saltans TaxID=151895 RepID=A0A2W5EL58_9SPHI|nr:MAG: hypothetical protein DI598_15920 [Pseudopedobacter saltans]
MKQLPSVVYKYFNWDDLESRKILTQREMYFCNAQKWKNYGEYAFTFKPIDKQKAFERIEQIAYKMRNTNLHQFEKWFYTHIYKYKIDAGNPELLNSIELDLWEARIVDEIIKHRVDDTINNSAAYEKLTKRNYFNRTGIFSTSLTKNSKQLWHWKSIYDKQLNNKAVCIGLNLDKINQRMSEIGNYSLGIIQYGESTNQVEYIGSGNDFITNQLNSIVFTLKNDAVSNITEQEELRITKVLIEDLSKMSPERFVTIDNDFITEILVSDKAPANVKNEIEEFAKSIGCANLSYV